MLNTLSLTTEKPTAPARPRAAVPKGRCVFQGLVAAAFLATGSAKLAGVSMMEVRVPKG